MLFLLKLDDYRLYLFKIIMMMHLPKSKETSINIRELVIKARQELDLVNYSDAKTSEMLEREREKNSK